MMLFFLIEILFIIIFHFLGINLCSYYGFGFYFDLVTPYLAYNMVTKNQGCTFAIILFLSAFIETHTSFPKGFYFISYGCLWGVFYSIKDTISWQMNSSWIVFFVVCELWMIVFEIIISLILLSVVSESTISYFVSALCRVLFAFMAANFTIFFKQKKIITGA